MQITIIMPVYEDWDAALRLCRNIDGVLRDNPSLRASLLLVDDGSWAATCPEELTFSPMAIERVAILTLRRNLGHQRAIAIALSHVREHCKGDAVVAMDADGEDRPEDIPVLVNAMTKASQPTVVFAERGRRLEGMVFRFSYRCYSLLHKLFTGRDIRFGNFSVLPWSHLDGLVVSPELWNHYSATVLKSRIPYIRVRCDRGRRLAGESRMNFVSLVTHGMSALFANPEVVGTRLLLLTLLTTMLVFLMASITLGVRFFSETPIPGWAVTVVGLLVVLGGQFLIGCFMLVFSIMMSRSHLGFLPIRDYSYFVSRETVIYQADPGSLPSTASTEARTSP